MIDPTAVTAVELAAIFGLSETHVGNLVRNGTLKPSGTRPGSRAQVFVLADAVAAFVQYKVDDKRMARQGPKPDRNALLVEQHRKLKIANDLAEGLTMLTADVATATDALAHAFRLHLEGQPGRMANELAGISEPALVKERLQDENRRILADIARHLAAMAEAKPDPQPAADEPEAKPDPQPRRRGRPRKERVASSDEKNAARKEKADG